jgi:glucokinase
VKSFLLVGDIGGTHARFALYQGGADGNGELHRHRTLSAVDHGAFDEAICAYLDSVGVQSTHLVGGGLAVAAPLLGGLVQFTNSPWSFAQQELQASLQLSRLTLLNDFEALAMRVPAVTSEEILTLRAGDLESRSARLVLGPGTGLGVAGVVPVSGARGASWQTLPCEGGHVSFAPSDDFEVDLLQFLQARYGRVSVERVLCGEGLVAIHQVLLSRSGVSDLRAITAAAVTSQALAGERLARESVLRFLAALGSFAGDCALMYAARGGVYIGGGIVPRFVSLLEESAFLDRFNDKGRMSPWVSQIPVHLLTDERSALRGVAMAIG